MFSRPRTSSKRRGLSRIAVLGAALGVALTSTSTATLADSPNGATPQTIYWGVRQGEEFTIVSRSGLDTEHASIVTKHTRANAVKYCASQVNSPADCVEEEMALPVGGAIHLNLEVHANCKTGAFVDFLGANYRFEGKKAPGAAAYPLYRIRYLGSDAAHTLLDGSDASNYPIVIDIFRTLCPREAKQPD